MKRLYQVYDRSRGIHLTHGGVRYFATKQDAKEARFQWQSVLGHDNIVVHLGPDHRKFGRKPLNNNFHGD